MSVISLSGSVGESGANLPNDVRTVKARLVELGFDWLALDGTLDSETTRTIGLFQAIKNGDRKIAGNPLNDGLVNVGAGTHLFLGALNAPRWMRFPLGSPAEGFHKHLQPGDEHDFGTRWLADTVRAAGRVYRAQYLSDHPDRPLISINDVSQPRGGRSPAHAGHQTGLDADLRLPRLDGGVGGIEHTSSQYDRATIRAMLQAIRMQPLVVRLRFNDPELIQGGLCQFTTGHDNHVHVDIAPPAPIKPAPIAVTINGTPSAVPGFLAENVTWVGCRDATIALRPFGTSADHVVAEGGEPFAITVSVKGAQHELAGIQLGGVGYVRSQELEPIYGVPFHFAMGSTPRLDIP